MPVSFGLPQSLSLVARCVDCSCWAAACQPLTWPLTRCLLCCLQLLGRCLSASHSVLERLEYVAQAVPPLLARPPGTVLPEDGADIDQSRAYSMPVLVAAGSGRDSSSAPSLDPARPQPRSQPLSGRKLVKALSLPSILLMTPKRFDGLFPGFQAWQGRRAAQVAAAAAPPPPPSAEGAAAAPLQPRRILLPDACARGIPLHVH